MKLGNMLVWLINMICFTFMIMDVMDMPFMEQFDTTYPLNAGFYFLFWIANIGFRTRVGIGSKR